MNNCVKFKIELTILPSVNDRKDIGNLDPKSINGAHCSTVFYEQSDHLIGKKVYGVRN